MVTTKAYQKPLSEEMARKCEEARGGVCHCRCGGRFHGRGVGKAEVAGGGLPFDYYNEELPVDDPHWLPNDEQKKRRKQDAYEQRKLAAKLKTAGKWHVYNGKCKAFEPEEITKDEAQVRGAYVPTFDSSRRYFACKNCNKVEGIY